MDREKFIKDLTIAGGKNVYGLIGSNEKLLSFLERRGFFDAPASTRFHGVYAGGLYDHSMNVTKRLLWLTESLELQWQRPESPWLIGIFHDLCKFDQYVLADGKYKTNEDRKLKGHGDKSVTILSYYMDLTEEEQLCIRYHMGAYETKDWNEFDKAIRKYPTVLYAHLADMLASKVDENE